MRGSRYAIMILLGLLGTLSISGCGTPDARALDASRQAEIESEVGEFLAAYREAFNAGDTDAIHEMYVGDDRFANFEDGVRRYATPAAGSSCHDKSELPDADHHSGRGKLRVRGRGDLVGGADVERMENRYRSHLEPA